MFSIPDLKTLEHVLEFRERDRVQASVQVVTSDACKECKGTHEMLLLDYFERQKAKNDSLNINFKNQS